MLPGWQAPTDPAPEQVASEFMDRRENRPVSILPVMSLYVLLQRFIIGGFAGGLKG